MEKHVEYSYDIFISYRNDGIGNAVASRLYADLTKQGYSVYYNPHVPSSSNFPDKIRSAVLGCNEMILVATEKCIQILYEQNSIDWVRDELLTAHGSGKHIIPIVVADASKRNLLDMSNPDNEKLPDNLKFILEGDHIYFAFEPRDCYVAPYDKLLSEIKAPKTAGYPKKDWFNMNPYYSVSEDFEHLVQAQMQNPDSSEEAYKLGVMYYYGFAVDEKNNCVVNYNEAARLFQKVISQYSKADDDCPAFVYSAYNFLGSLYFCGEVPGEKQSYVKAFEYQQIAAKHNDKSAMFQHAFNLRTGCGCEYDFYAAEAYYRKIIEDADSTDSNELIKLYSSGGKTHTKEIMDLILSMDNPTDEAIYELGMIYKAGINVDPPRPNYHEAIYYLLQIVKRNPNAAFEVGMMYFRPCGRTPKNFVEAQNHFKTAADFGIAEAQYMLGYMYEHGLVEKNIDEAVKYYEAALKQEHSLAALQLARIYQTKKYRNYEKAFQCASLSAKTGSAEGALMMGVFYMYGRGCEYDLGLAVENLRIAENAGYYRATVMLDTLRAIDENKRNEEHDIDIATDKCDSYSEESQKEAFETFKKYIHNPMAMNRLALCYHIGRGTAVDAKKAFELFSQSAECGYRGAIFNLADCYYYGDGIGEDVANAVRLYKQLIDEEDIKSSDHDAEFIVGKCYQYGIGNVKKDINNAIKYLRMAVNSYYPLAFLNLAECYRELGNEEMTFNSIYRAANQHITEAMSILAKYYREGMGTGPKFREGFGTPPNPIEAERWEKLAQRDSKNNAV